MSIRPYSEVDFLTGVVAAVACGLFAWAAARVPTKWLALTAAPFLILDAAGVVFRLPFYPFTNFFVAAFALPAGVTLGRIMPPRFIPFLILLLLLSAFDVAQNVVFFGPFDPIWLNVLFRPAPGDRFQIGFAELILISAVTENLRRRGVSLALSLLPGVIGISLGQGLLATLPAVEPGYVTDIAISPLPFLTAGYALTELAASQQRSPLSGTDVAAAADQRDRPPTE